MFQHHFLKRPPILHKTWRYKNFQSHTSDVREEYSVNKFSSTMSPTGGEWEPAVCHQTAGNDVRARAQTLVCRPEFYSSRCEHDA